MATLEAELAGLDALELSVPPRRSRASRIWAAVWPKLGAVAIALLLWQIIVWSGWKPEYVLPGPVDTFEALFDNFGDYVVRRRRHPPTCGDRLRRRGRRRNADRRTGRPEPHPALRGRLDDHRPDDHAVDRLVPRRDRALRAAGERDPVRDRHRRRAVDRATASSPGSTTLPRSCVRAARMLGAKGWTNFRRRRAAGRAPHLRDRPQAGLGVRVAEPPRRRAARADRGQGVTRSRARQRRGSSRTTRGCTPR